MELGAIGRVGVVGAGLVGTGWAIVFARAGLDVVVYDADAKRRGAIKAEIDQSDCAAPAWRRMLSPSCPESPSSTGSKRRSATRNMCRNRRWSGFL